MPARATKAPAAPADNTKGTGMELNGKDLGLVCDVPVPQGVYLVFCEDDNVNDVSVYFCPDGVNVLASTKVKRLTQNVPLDKALVLIAGKVATDLKAMAKFPAKPAPAAKATPAKRAAKKKVNTAVAKTRGATKRTPVKKATASTRPARKPVAVRKTAARKSASR